MSNATRDKTKEKQAEQPDQDALDLLESLSFRRRSKHMLDDMELAKLYALLQHFMESPALRTAPSKNQLMAAVNALLPANAAMISTKFNKPQLAAVLHKWVQEAQLLDDASLQQKLFVEIKTIRGNRKHINLAEAIFIEEDDGSVAALSISSPGPSTSKQHRGKVPIVQDENFLADFSATPLRLASTPSSIATSASSFARQANGAGSLQTLAATETADPGVRRETAPDPANVVDGGELASLAPRDLISSNTASSCQCHLRHTQARTLSARFEDQLQRGGATPLRCKSRRACLRWTST